MPHVYRFIAGIDIVNVASLLHWYVLSVSHPYHNLAVLQFVRRMIIICSMGSFIQIINKIRLNYRDQRTIIRSIWDIRLKLFFKLKFESYVYLRIGNYPLHSGNVFLCILMDRMYALLHWYVVLILHPYHNLAVFQFVGRMILILISGAIHPDNK